MRPMYSFEELQCLIDEEITRRMTALKFRKPAELFAPVNYSLEVGGKRLRPVLLLMAYNLFRENLEKAVPAALSVEIFHNFTLLHDDIMDKAAVRRNKPTVHKKFSENNAILSGDAMAFLSYQYLLECPQKNLSKTLRLFTKTALEVCEGQQYDMDFENRMDVSEEEYLEMIRLKTAVLIGCSLKAGAILADTPDATAQQLYDLGINLGLAFQLQDDWLDTFGTLKNFGKKIGGDILANKKTYLLINALQTAEGHTKKALIHWLGISDYDENEKIRAITGIYNELNVEAITIKKIRSCFDVAYKILRDLPVNEQRKKALELMVRKMLVRSA